MKKLFSILFISTVVLTSCGPAAEDRFQMDRIAKRMSDSLFHLIDSSLKDPGTIINFTAQPIPAPPQPTAAATPTTK
jgi:hypothetical protein